MKFTSALISGLARSVRVWKGVLIYWFVSLLFASLIAIPLKASLHGALGNSMITELLSDGFNAEIIPDLGTAFGSMLSSFMAGLFFMILAFFPVNVFMTGGLFESLKSDCSGFSASGFFMASSKHFRPFFIIMLVTEAIIIFLVSIVMIIPAVIVSMSEQASEKAVFNTLIISAVFLTVILIILLLVADYARAWQSASPGPAGFKALGFGFRKAFSHFGSSFLLMFAYVIIQLLFTLVSFKIISGWKPGNSAGIFLLFMVSQLLFFIKIALRTWRYAGITALMEMHFAKDVHPVRNTVNNIDEKPETDFII